MMKAHFPIFHHHPQLVYLDSAASTQKPHAMMQALNFFYSHHNSNIGRGYYELASLAQEDYDHSKQQVAEFIGCSSQNIIYSSGATDSLNLAAFLISQRLASAKAVQHGKRYIILPISEHHANILVWQQLAKHHQLEIYWLQDPQLIAQPEQMPAGIMEQAAVVAMAHVSNVTGEIYPVAQWCQAARTHGALTVIDGSQAVASLAIDISQISCDFYAFSSHKIYGPMGLGVLFIANELLALQPQRLGGGIIEDVDQQGYSLIQEPQRFEAGTPNVANAFALAKTLEFLSQHDWPALLRQMDGLGEYARQQLLSMEGLRIVQFCPQLPTTHIVSFTLEHIHAHDVGTFLAGKGIACRVGKHCTYPLHEHLHLASSARISMGIYNDAQDIDKLIKALKQCIEYFR